ncbi:MAG: two-component regulator propeller domain-containing protein [Bacteroidota bacterium]|nr:two-component regulator propeller domain-containing protein [Bacteroidota bacterium]
MINKPISYFLLLLVIFLLAGPVSAQKPKLKFRSIKASDGLINSTVQAIFEDSYGFIWLGTHHGVQRYDGRSFTTFTTEDSDSTGLSHNYITDFCEDENGDIWIGTSIGLNRYSREQDRIYHYRWKGENAQEYDRLGVLRVIHDEQKPGTLWITSRGRLIKLNTKTDEAVSFTIPANRNPLILVQLYSSLFPNHLLVGSTELYLFDKSSGEFKVVHALEQSNDVFENRFNDIAFDPNNENIVWCATGDIWGRGSLGGLLRIDLENGDSKIFSRESHPGEIPDRHILSVCFSGPQKLWVGTRNNAVLLYDLGQDRFFNYQYNEYDEGSLVTENAIRSMLVDQSGTLWLGTWGDGVSLLSPALQKFTHYKHLPGIKEGLPDNWISGITEDKNGNIWIGTKSGGLSKFDPDSKTFENHFQEFNSPDDPIEITYVFYDSRDNLWIGTYAHALYRYNPKTGKKIHYSKGNGPGSVSQKRISAIAELVPGEILISTYGGGLNIYTYDSDAFRRFVNNPNDSTSIPDNQIWIPFLGDDGNYYVGGNSMAGLIRFNPETEKFSEPLTRPNFNTFLNSVKDSRGRIFIDALSFGLSELYLKDTITVRPLTDKDGNRIIGGESAAVDDQDIIWMGTDNGLIKYDPLTKDLVRYDPDDGLQGFQFYRFAAYTSSSGTMYFGGLNGLNTFDPGNIQVSEFQPPVALTGFKLFRKSLEIDPGSPLQKNILLTDKIDLRHNQNDFSISFSGLDYSNPHKIHYRYKLVNHDDNWIDAGNFTTAAYTNMDPGTYTFMVKSTNADGVWNDKTTSLQILIHSPWWQTTVAYIFYGLILILGVIALDRFQRKRLREKERAQAREKELAQAREIEKAYQELKATQKQLIHSEKMASLGELTAGIAHEIQNPLNFVNNFSEVSADIIEDLFEEIENNDSGEVKAIAADLKQNLQKITHHGHRASSIVKGMLEHSRSSSGQKVPTDLNALVDEYLRLAYHGLRAKDKSFNADFKSDFDPDLPNIAVIPQDIGRVVLNLINNAFYAAQTRRALSQHAPTVTVSTKNHGDHIEITVKDNGNGIPDLVKDKIFQPFFTTKPTGQGTGLGLSLSYDIVKAHGGEIKVETTANQGTTFIITLPK